ncbi:ribosomal protein S16 [Lepidopterella palustris CBS 459.81]|uniref:Ribosomal protein S16 n=1 Tax=Lepidopterella palustris CBS 459.81 TaxID=1314670 RepID=A0A8E2EJL1_9PEZI|nr:ribosomal protein S16 [Lepidopterella palustris CBS 459.81]
MVLRIRLARFGKRHAPFYNLVVAHARTARNSKPLEVLGTYNSVPQPPRPGDTQGRPFKEIKLDSARARYWIGVGAQPSDTAWRLLSMVGILEPKYRVGQIKQQVVKADSAARSATKSTILPKDEL